MRDFRLRHTALLVAVAAVVPAPLFAQPDETIRAVEAAWKEREARIPKFRVEWQQERTHFRGSRTEILGTKSKDGSPLPSADRTLIEQDSFVGDGRKLRYEHDGHAFNAKREDWVGMKSTAVYDGTKNLQYTQAQGAESHVAKVEPNRPPDGLRSSDLFPVMQAVRPASPDLAFVDLTQFRATGQSAKIRGHACVELAKTSPDGRWRTALWVAPAAGYVIVRRQESTLDRSPGAAGEQADIDYREAAPGLWVPTAWTVVKAGRTIPVATKLVGTVSVFELSAEVAGKEFRTTPPPKSLVQEFDSEGKMQKYVTRPDGAVAGYDRTHPAETRDEMLGTGRGHWWARNRGRIGAAVLVLIVALVVSSVRKRWRPVRKT